MIYRNTVPSQPMNVLSVHKVSKRFGERLLFNDLGFGLQLGQKAGLVAANGAGKSTLLKILMDKEQPDDGEVVFRKDLRVGFLSQEDDLDPSKTVMEEVLRGDSEELKVVRRYSELLEAGGMHPDFEHAMERMHELNAWDFEGRISEILGKLGIQQRTAQIASCSGGQRKRIQLARVLLENPDFLILDEPTNHLDLQMIEWLEDYLFRANLTLLLVTHDRYFLESVCDTILELDRGRIFVHEGNFSAYMEQKADREAQLESTVEKARNLYRRELEWVRKMPQARGTKQKARLQAFDKTKEVAFTNLDKKTMRPSVNTERLGTKIIELHKVAKSYGDKLLLQGFSYNFLRGERAGLVGPNGTGKTTLLKIIGTEVEPDAGKVVVGETVKIGWYKQDGLPEGMAQKKVIDVVRDIAEYIPLKKGQQMTAAQLLEQFLFPRDVHYRYAYTLSGGERKRLYLLTILMSNPNFLILDEPTNDLDIATMTVLEDFLLDFEGCVLVVSHDRYFLDKICQHVFAFEEAGTIKDFPGNYTEYREWRTAQLREKKSEPVVLTETKPSEEPKIDVAKTKLSYKEKLEFEQLDKQIPELEQRREQMNAQLAEGAVAASDQASFFKDLSTLSEEIEGKTMRWLELAERV